MGFIDILILAIRNLRESRLRTLLTSSGVAVGVAVVVTMVSFGLGLQRNTVSRFRDIELFNEVTVSGRSLVNIVSGGEDPERRTRPGGRSGAQKAPERILSDAAINEMQTIAGVESVEPTIFFTAYLRANERTLLRTVGGALIPNTSPRFKEFAAGSMIASRDVEDAVVDETFARDFGFERPDDAVGQSVEFLAPASDARDEEPLSFFGLPLEEEGRPTDQNDDGSAPRLIARSFRISGVLKEQVSEASGARRVRGLVPTANVYIPSAAARSMALRYRSALSEVALELARSSGVLSVEDEEGYQSAVVRASDPSYVTDIRKKLEEMGFGTFSILDQLEQIRTFFLIINSVLGLLGGISLLVASLGIANTMLMSIFERTREIGVMKAIGGEDREIKLIFFVEASIIGLIGGVAGALAAWGLDAIANRLVYQFVLKPQDAGYVDFFDLPPYLWLGAILFAIIVSILAALYPASRAARIDPVKALRSE